MAFAKKDYDLAQFRGIREDRSPHLDLSKPVVLWGKSGKAKTDFAMAQGKYPLLVDEIDKLKEISPFTDLLVFDDMSFGPNDLNWTPAQVIRLLDTRKERVIKCRYTNAKRPKAHWTIGGLEKPSNLGQSPPHAPGMMVLRDNGWVCVRDRGRVPRGRRLLLAHPRAS